jgi:Periplasmic protein involved in polysaccharide export
MKIGHVARIAAILLLGIAGNVAAITPDQMQAFQQLDASTQQSILSKLGRGGTSSAAAAPQTAPETPPLVVAPPAESSISSRLAAGELRVQGGDTLVIRLGFTKVHVSAPNAAATVAETNTTQFANTAQLVITDNPTEEQVASLSAQVPPLLGSHVYTVDRDGVLELPGVAYIPLAGLNAEESAKRIISEPLLKGLMVEVTLLPLEPIGAKALQPFGYDLFAGVPTTFAPATDIPVPSNYVIGPGDTIQLQLFGKENQQYSLVVSRDGTVNFPNIGPISVAGQSFDKMQKNLSERIASQMIGMQASITMGPLRSIRVFVLGDAARPGSYTVSGLSTVTNALFVSGGIKPNGSLRNIQLKRNGKVIQNLDLYDLLLRGDTRADQRLLPGDVIFIPPVGRTVGVAGEVKRPAIYELRSEKNAAELIALAGGLLPTAAPDAVRLERVAQGGARSLLDLDLKQPAGASYAVSDGDVLFVRSILETTQGYVRVSGHVQRPGDYQWREGLRLTDVLSTVDLLRPRADLDYVLIKRELPPDLRFEAISARLSRALAHADSQDNVLLQPRDEIMVFSLADDRAALLKPLIDQLRLQARTDDPERVVKINGSVPFPGDYPLESAMRVSDLVRASGGLGQQAYALEAELIHYRVAEGKLREVEREPVDLSAALRGEPDKDRELRPFDALNVKIIPEWSEQQSVEIIGEVAFPGTYVVKKGETLADLIHRAGGLTVHAYPRGAVFLRQELQKKEQQQLERLRSQLKADLAAVSLSAMQEGPQAQQSVAAAQGLLMMLETTKAAGRLVINLPKILEDDKRYDVALKDGDKVFIPDHPQEISIIGEVNYPTSHLYDSGMNRDTYINRSGGLTYKADEDRIYVIRANGEVVASGNGGWFDNNWQQDIQPGDTIVVPLDAERMRPLAFWGTVAQVVYHIALSAAAFKSVF